MLWTWVTIIIIFRLLQDQRKWNCVNHVLYWLLVKMKSVSGLGGQDTKSQTDRLTVRWVMFSFKMVRNKKGKSRNQNKISEKQSFQF